MSLTASAPITAPPSAKHPAEALLHRLEWTVLRRLDGLLPGAQRLLWRGSGTDLVDLRPYQHGDDLRRIDWHVTARLHDPHVRQYADERGVDAWFLVDLSASMGAAVTVSPLERGTALVALLAQLLTRQHCRIGALLYRPQSVTAPSPTPARALELLRPAGTRQQVLRLLLRLQPPMPASPRPPQTPHHTDLAELLQGAERLVRRRSLLFVISDFLSRPGWVEPLGRLALRHDVMAVRLGTPAWPATLPRDSGLIRIGDAESGEQMLIDTHDPAFRARLSQLSQARETAVRQALQRTGADTLELHDHDDLLDALLRCIELRRRRPLRLRLAHLPPEPV